jgi:Ran GTPase-activating protein (RanGAP) involved in mRNA processing and transport
MTFPVFRSVQDLCNVLREQSEDLKVLSLNNLMLGPRNRKEWSREDCEALAIAISSCNNLVNLSINDCHFCDEDVKVMLSDLPNLQCLG